MLGPKLAAALLAAQKEMSMAIKDAKNPFFKSKFADLNAVREAVMPSLHKHGVSVLQPTVHQDGKSFVRTVLLHETGEMYTSDTEILAVKQNDPQAMGSAISYARRYGLQSLMCVGATDDDAEASMGRGPQPIIAAKVVQPTMMSKVTPVVESAPVIPEVVPVEQPKAVARASYKNKVVTKPVEVAPKVIDSPDSDGWD